MRTVLKIDGMHCSGCSNAVGKALAATPGVTAVSVDLGSGRATVETDSATSPDTLVRVVVDAGYEASVAN